MMACAQDQVQWWLSVPLVGVLCAVTFVLFAIGWMIWKDR